MATGCLYLWIMMVLYAYKVMEDGEWLRENTLGLPGHARAGT